MNQSLVDGVVEYAPSIPVLLHKDNIPTFSHKPIFLSCCLLLIISWRCVLIIALEIVHDTEAGCPARISPTIISPYSRSLPPGDQPDITGPT